MSNNDDLLETGTHDELIEAYLLYFDCLERYKRRRSYRAAIDVRKSLSTIRTLAVRRRKEVSADHAVQNEKKKQGKN